jgi:hypothetical protein
MNNSETPKEPRTEAEVLTQAMKQIRSNLEPLMGITAEVEKLLAGMHQVDAMIKLSAQARELSKFVVEIKGLPEIRDVQRASRQIQELAMLAKNSQPMIVGKFLSPPVQEWLRKANISFADATGNFSLVDPNKLLFIQSDMGAKTNPWKGPGRERSTLKGEAASRVVRGLIQLEPPYSLPKLIKVIGSSNGVTYRVVEYLEKQGLLVRDEVETNKRVTSKITKVDWQGLLEAWAKDYSFNEYNAVTSYMDSRGIDEVLRKLRNINSSVYAITGSVAASNYEKYAESKQLRIYAKNAEKLAEELKLVEVESGVNVQIATTQYKSVFENTRIMSNLNLVAIPQIAVDLLSGPGRNPSEGKAIMKWMKENEEKWRIYA